MEKKIPGKALKEKPQNSAFENFVEANRVLSEASQLMPGSSLTPKRKPPTNGGRGGS